MPLPICSLGFEQNGNAERHGKARATAVSWPKDTCPHGVWHNPSHLHFDKSRSLGLSTTGAAHAPKAVFIKFLSLVKQRGHEKLKTLEDQEIGVKGIFSMHWVPLFSPVP